LIASDKKFWDSFRQTCLIGDLNKAILMVPKQKPKTVSNHRWVKIRSVRKRFTYPYAKSGSEKLGIKINKIQTLIAIYENYWHKSLLKRSSHHKFEEELIKSLQVWLLKNYKLKSTPKNCYQKIQCFTF
jgi:hypothetical protein